MKTKRLAMILPVCLAWLGLMGATDHQWLRNERVVFADAGDIYFINGAGTQMARVLHKRKHKLNYDCYFQPSLSPDGSKIACIRDNICDAAGYSIARPHAPIQKHEAVILSLKDKQETVFFNSPTEEIIRDGRIIPQDAISPVWSLDGREIFFLVGNRLLAFRLDEARTRQIATLPEGHGGHLFHPNLAGEYLRLSKNGGKIFAFVSTVEIQPSYNPQEHIWQIDLSDGTTTKLWSSLPRPPPFRGDDGNLYSPPPPRPEFDSMYNKVRALPQKLDEEVIETLFGSREFPVLAPQFSKDRRFYFYYMWQEGFLAKWWIGGYDTAKHKSFVVKTLHRRLYVE